MKYRLAALLLVTVAFLAGFFCRSLRLNDGQLRPKASKPHSVMLPDPGAAGQSPLKEKTAASARVTNAKEQGAVNLAAYLEFLRSAEGVDLARRESKVQVKRVYAPLFRRFDLSPEKQATFKELLIETVSASREAYLSNVSGQASRIEIEKIAADQRKNIESEIRALLGNKFNEYQEFNSAQTERLEIKEIADSAASASEQLTEAQIDVISRTFDRINASSPELQENKLKESPASRQARYGLLLEEVSRVLTPEQFKNFSEGIRDRLVIRNARGTTVIK